MEMLSAMFLLRKHFKVGFTYKRFVLFARIYKLTEIDSAVCQSNVN